MQYKGWLYCITSAELFVYSWKQFYLTRLVFWDVRLCNPVSQPTYGWTYRFHLQGRREAKQQMSKNRAACLPPCSDYYSTLQTDGTCSSEMFLDFYRTTGRYMTGGIINHNYNCDWGSISDPMAVKITKVPLFQTSYMLYLHVPVVPAVGLLTSSSSISDLYSEWGYTPRWIYRTGLSRSNTLDLYSGGAWFESWPGHRLYYRRVFMVSLNSPGTCGVGLVPH
jgi:hypothetical protein